MEASEQLFCCCHKVSCSQGGGSISLGLKSVTIGISSITLVPGYSCQACADELSRKCSCVRPPSLQGRLVTAVFVVFIIGRVLTVLAWKYTLLRGRDSHYSAIFMFFQLYAMGLISWTVLLAHG